MSQYLLDTNHVSALWLGSLPVVDRIRSQPSSDFAICLPTVGELWFMVFKSARPTENRSGLKHLLREFNLLHFDGSAAIEFGKIKTELLRSGTVIPAVDVQIAAVARARGLILLTADAHFSYVGGLITENWTT